MVEVGPGAPPRELFAAADVPLAGVQNLENAMAAALLAPRPLGGASPRRSAPASRGFRGLPHRLERVGEAGGVAWYDDSKGTNPGATAKAIEGFADGTVHLILGGRNKGADLASLAPHRPPQGAARLPDRRGGGETSRGRSAALPHRERRDARPRRAPRPPPRRGRATRSSSRRPAPASISSATSTTAARSSRTSCAPGCAGAGGLMAKKLAFDKVLFTTVVLLVGVGLVMVYSASAAVARGSGLAGQPVPRQAGAGGRRWGCCSWAS